MFLTPPPKTGGVTTQFSESLMSGCLRIRERRPQLKKKEYNIFSRLPRQETVTPVVATVSNQVPPSASKIILYSFFLSFYCSANYYTVWRGSLKKTTEKFLSNKLLKCLDKSDLWFYNFI